MTIFVAGAFVFLLVQSGRSQPVTQLSTIGHIVQPADSPGVVPVEEIRQAVTFDVVLPQSAPDYMTFGGASVIEDPGNVQTLQILYKAPDEGRAIFFETTANITAKRISVNRRTIDLDGATVQIDPGDDIGRPELIAAHWTRKGLTVLLEAILSPRFSEDDFMAVLQSVAPIPPATLTPGTAIAPLTPTQGTPTTAVTPLAPQ